MGSGAADDTTQILNDLVRGKADAAQRLMPLVYDELRAMAERHFRNQAPGQTLQATAVVHEAYLRMVDQTSANYESRTHFMAVAATAMRQILIDRARRRGARKRGGDRSRVPLDAAAAELPPRDAELLALDEALRKLEQLDERKARIIELRFFGGLSIEETADAMGLARSTVTQDWRAARAWLASELQDDRSAE